MASTTDLVARSVIEASSHDKLVRAVLHSVHTGEALTLELLCRMADSDDSKVAQAPLTPPQGMTEEGGDVVVVASSAAVPLDGNDICQEKHEERQGKGLKRLRFKQCVPQLPPPAKRSASAAPLPLPAPPPPSATGLEPPSGTGLEPSKQSLCECFANSHY